MPRVRSRESTGRMMRELIDMSSLWSGKFAGRLDIPVIAFILVTFVLTYVFDYWLILAFGDIGHVPPYSTLVQMLIPAAVAICCLFAFRDRTVTRESTLLFAVFAITAITFLFEMTIGPILPPSLVTLPIYRFMPALSIIVSAAGAVIIIAMNLCRGWRAGLRPSGVSAGSDLRWYLIIPGLFALLFAGVYYLNHLSGFGDPIFGYSPGNFVAGLGVNLVIGFFVGWIFYFGEEYGWRIYLQDRLFTAFGGIAGVLLLGLIWGLWHSGLIVMGMNYPGQPLVGNIVMILLTVVMGIFYSFAVLKTGSVWIAIFLHLITDTMEPLAWMYISYPTDMVLSFGTGIYGIVILGIVAVFLLRHPIWRHAREIVAGRRGDRDRAAIPVDG